KREARTFSFVTLHGEIAVHCPGEVTAYRQSKPDAAFPISEPLLQLDERLEDGFVLVRGNANSCIADPQRHSVGCRSAVGAYLATRWGELDRVREKVY